MARETIASVREEIGALLADETERRERADKTAADALATMRKEQAEHEATRQRCEGLEADRRRAESNVALLRGFAIAKLSPDDFEALPPEFADFLRGSTVVLSSDAIDRYAFASYDPRGGR